MGKADEYRHTLISLTDWDEYLLINSGLPGPRGNLELAAVVADMGNLALFEKYIIYDPQKAPVNSPYEFLAFCGVLGLGRLVAEGEKEYLQTIRSFASDPRWRLREGVAQALQRWGKVDMAGLLQEMHNWASGCWLEKRAAAAALAEPVLLQKPGQVKQALLILDAITASILANQHRKDADFLTLRQGLGYCWSVVVAALPEEGIAFMQKWLAYSDPDIRWIMKENLKKTRLARIAPEWVDEQLQRL
ncbi:MAG: hypothetical protein JW908_12080 [Anaerolineales bacterium]|nr:hypothetical protein [Anaerolineales bacterium]